MKLPNSQHDFEWATDMRRLVTKRVVQLAGGRCESIAESMLICLLCNGHVLIEGAPGTGKTMVFEAFATSFTAFFRRIAMTSDLWPPDLLGRTVMGHGEPDYFEPGPIFCNFVLLDQIEHTVPRTVTSLFDVLQRRKVTVDGETYDQLAPFMACVTRSEASSDDDIWSAQLDRFSLSFELKHPSIDEELEMITTDRELAGADSLPAVADVDDIKRLQSLTHGVTVDTRLLETMTMITAETRVGDCSKYILGGVSSRASKVLKKAVQARALIHGRRAATVEDVDALLAPVLRHRIALTFSARAEGVTVDEMIKRIRSNVFRSR